MWQSPRPAGLHAGNRLIGAYIEGINHAAHFLDALRKAALKKPVIMWKVGLTLEGARAAASHTGAMASAPKIWHGVLQQAGALPVVGFEALVDALMGFSMLPANPGNRMAIITYALALKYKNWLKKHI